MKRGSSGLSLVVGVNKPTGMTSHDVVNRCRSIFGEKRVGHTGTLDPLAQGAIPVCIGPATRLDKYLVGHGKTYIADITFGASTTTDDSEGDIVETGAVDPRLFDERYARSMVIAEIGERQQTPPAYSAVKVDGTKAYEAARKGREIELSARTVFVYDAALLAIETDGGNRCTWTVEYRVSKGTYIRSLARDLGKRLGCPAHMSALKRTNAGLLSLEECVTLETLETLKSQAALDPVRLLGYRFAFGDEIESKIANGNKLAVGDLVIYDAVAPANALSLCACTASIEQSVEGPQNGEFISVVVANKLKAVYRFDAGQNCYVPDCVFSIGVSRV